jgi:hypothetical protein
MRIKSYFAPSVQAAIALARKEFGDGVTLVTSHVASLDNRHLGEYEVVFAIEEVIKEEEAVEDKAALETPVPVFTQLLQQAIQAPSPMHENLDDKLEHIHSSLVALGLDASLVRSFMTMLKAVLPAVPALPAPAVVEEAGLPCEIEETVMEEAPVLIEEVPEDEPVLPAAIAVEELPAPKPKITIIKSEPQAAKPEPVKSDPGATHSSPRPFLSLFEGPRPESRFSASELAFMSSVSSSKEQKA